MLRSLFYYPHPVEKLQGDRGAGFYPLVTDDNSERLPKIIPKDAINRDFASRIFIKSESFSQWEKRGYTLSVKLDPLDYRMFSSPLTKSSGGEFPFLAVVTYSYSSLEEQYSTVKQISEIVESVGKHLPFSGARLEDKDDYLMIIVQNCPSNCPPQEYAMFCITYFQNCLYSLNGVSMVEIIYLWDTESGKGSGGGGGSSGGSVTPPDSAKIDRSPKELANAKDKFVPFEEGRDCMEICREVMDKFGLTGKYGDSQHVFQLLINKDGVSKYPSDATTFNNAIDCIDTHLNNNRPIIVGVNINDHPVTGNIDGTDHFVVIIGRGSDAQGKYYTYMETGTSYADKGYNPSENRLYVNPKTNGLTDSSSFQRERYDVTNVRPNDGNNYDTTPLKSTF